MIDLKHCTFLIPTAIDSPDRLQNILLVVKYLTTHFETNVFIGEQGNLNCVIEEQLVKHNLNRECVKCYKFDFGEITYFNRQGIFNRLASLSNTKCISLYDTDVLLLPNQYEMSCKQIIDNQFDMVYPYGGMFYEVAKQHRERIFQSLNLEEVDIKNCKILNPNSLGGAVIYNRDVFMQGGMENENFKGWGQEDNERYIRFAILGYRQCRVSGPLFHFEHDRARSLFYIPNSDSNNYQQLLQIQTLTREQLQEQINNWYWCKYRMFE